MNISPAVGEYLYRRLKKVQREFGMARLELGTILETFKNNDHLWRGRAESFNAFMEEERIQPNGAYQFMKVAKAFVLEHKLSNEELEDISTANFRVLELAARVITPENREDVIALLAALGERDARASLLELEQEGQTAPAGKPIQPTPVKSLMRRFRDLPDDQRSAFLSQVAPIYASRQRPASTDQRG